MPSSILRLPAVMQITGLSRSTIYLRIARGAFPRPVSLGARAVGWRENEIHGWLEQLPQKPPNPAIRHVVWQQKS
jgi:prophage regulatory protein